MLQHLDGHGLTRTQVVRARGIIYQPAGQRIAIAASTTGCDAVGLEVQRPHDTPKRVSVGPTSLFISASRRLGTYQLSATRDSTSDPHIQLLSVVRNGSVGANRPQLPAALCAAWAFIDIRNAPAARKIRGGDASR